MKSARLDDQRARFAGILPWQHRFALFLCGLASLRCPDGAVVAAVLLVVFQPRLVPAERSRLLGPLFFLAGVGVVLCLRPGGEPPVPDWMQEGRKARIRAAVQAVHPKPEHRMRIVLKDVERILPDQSTTRLPAGVVWTWKNPGKEIHPGQTVRARFKLKPVRGFLNPGTWDRRFYWAIRGVGYRTFTEGDAAQVRISGSPGVLRETRESLRASVMTHAGSGRGGKLLLALLMGDRSLLSFDLLDLVRRASLAHSLALSGLHLGFMVSLGWMLAWLSGRIKPHMYARLPRQRLAIFLAVPLVALYLWLGQWRLSLLRAALMFFFWGLLLLRGRNKVLLDGLFFAVTVLVLTSPLAVFDLGLQFSVVAVAGIILLWPLLANPVQRLSRGGFWPTVAAAPFLVLLVSVVANAALLPLMAHSFGILSPHLYLNVLWLPALGWAVLPLGLLGLGLCALPGGEAAGGPMLFAAAQILELLVHVLEGLDARGLMPVLLTLRPLWPQMLGYWLLLGLAAAWWRRPDRVSWTLVGLALALLVAPSFMREAHVARNRVGMQVMDVGQGQAVCLSLPGGRRILVDGGGSWNREFDIGRFVLTPALTRNRPPALDRVVLSHPDFDHMRGLYYILDRFSVQEFVFNGVWPSGWDGRRLRQSLRDGGVPSDVLKSGDRLNLGGGLALEVLHSGEGRVWDKVNNSSLALRLTYRGRGLALIPGDLEVEGLRSLLRKGAELNAQVLVVPHHGSRTSFCPALYREVDPRVAVVSCKSLSYFGFPHEEVVDELNRRGVPVLTTAREGQIRVDWHLSGNRMTLRTAERGEVTVRRLRVSHPGPEAAGCDRIRPGIDPGWRCSQRCSACAGPRGG